MGSSSCEFSTQMANRNIIRNIKLEVKEIADENGLSFTTIAIAKDWSPQDGIGHIENFGYFDEIIVGSNWKNTGILRYVWESDMSASVPQIAIIQRTVTNNSDGLKVDNERVLVAKSGISEITTWFENGRIIPSISIN